VHLAFILKSGGTRMYLIFPGPITVSYYIDYIKVRVSCYTPCLSNQQEIHYICQWHVCFVYTYKRPFMSETGAYSALAEVAELQITKQLPSVCISCCRHTCIVHTYNASYPYTSRIQARTTHNTAADMQRQGTVQL